MNFIRINVPFIAKSDGIHIFRFERISVYLILQNVLIDPRMSDKNAFVIERNMNYLLDDSVAALHWVTYMRHVMYGLRYDERVRFKALETADEEMGTRQIVRYRGDFTGRLPDVTRILTEPNLVL